MSSNINIENDKSNSYKYTIKLDDNNFYHIFTFKKTNNFFIFNFNIITNYDIINCLVSGNNEKGKIYTNYSLIDNPISIIITKENENNEQSVFIKIEKKYAFDEIKIKIDAIKNVNIINTIPNIDETYLNDEDNIFINKNFTNNFIESEINKLDEMDVKKDDFTVINIDLDIGNTKADINNNDDEYIDKEIIPYEDENYKGPQFLYSIFYNSGIPFNKFIKFEGNITINGISYPISYIKISEPIDNENKFGTIQFLFDSDTKLLSDVSKTKYISDEKESINGITFFPIIINDEYEYEYVIDDNISNSLSTQNANASIFINDYTINNDCIDKIVVKDDICAILSKNDIYIFDLISLRPIYTKHFSYEKYNNLEQIGIITHSNDEYNFIIKSEDGKKYILSNNTLDVIENNDSVNIDEKDILIHETLDLNSNFISQKIKNMYKKRYQLLDNEYKIEEIKFENNENYFGFIYDETKNAFRLSCYRDNMINNGNVDIKNVEIVPNIVESLDGILYCPNEKIRDGYPRSFENE